MLCVLFQRRHEFEREDRCESSAKCLIKTKTANKLSSLMCLCFKSVCVESIIMSEDVFYAHFLPDC